MRQEIFLSRYQHGSRYLSSVDQHIPHGSNEIYIFARSPQKSDQVASKVLLDPLKLVHVKLARAQCLAKAGFPAEAASALAAILKGGGSTFTSGSYAGAR